MKRFACHWLVASSLLLGSLVYGETRPQYGGTLHMAMHVSPTTLDPADDRVPDSFARRTLTAMLFDTLVTWDDAARVRPALAESWQATKGNQRWQFRLRRAVKLHDGSPLTPEVAAASLRAANPAWNVRADGDAIIIDCDGPNPEMLAELALSRNAIVKRDSDRVSGTGPFRIVDWQPGKKLTLAADEDCWRGRPYLDGIEIELGRGYRDQMTSLESGKTDVAEIAPEQSHHFSQARGRLVTSSPIELLALVFSRDVSTAGEKTLREALALGVERGSMHSVLLQGAGQPAGGLLPTWISGYGFVFPVQADLAKARQLREQVHVVPIWTIGFDGSDSLARLLAERIALNAKDAGLSVVPTSPGAVDLRVARIPLSSSDPWVALERLTTTAGIPPMKAKSSSAEDVYQAEQAALATQRIIPLFHLPAAYASVSRIKNWAVQADGSVQLADAWIESARP